MSRLVIQNRDVHGRLVSLDGRTRQQFDWYSFGLPGAAWRGTIRKMRPTELQYAIRARFFLVKGFLSIRRHSINFEPRTELHLVAGDFLEGCVSTVYKCALLPSALLCPTFSSPPLISHSSPSLTFTCRIL